MSVYGYARVSSEDQSTAIQAEALKAAGCVIVREEKASGARLDGRPELDTLMQFLRAGDVLMVTRVDRLARSLRDLQNIVHDLRSRGVVLRATEQPIDTTSAAGNAFLSMLGVFAQFETEIRRERQAEGIAKARQAGLYRGSDKRVARDEVRRLVGLGQGPTEVGKALGISRQTVYRVMKEAGEPDDDATDVAHKKGLNV